MFLLASSWTWLDLKCLVLTTLCHECLMPGHRGDHRLEVAGTIASLPCDWRVSQIDTWEGVSTKDTRGWNTGFIPLGKTVVTVMTISYWISTLLHAVNKFLILKTFLWSSGFYTHCFKRERMSSEKEKWPASVTEPGFKFSTVQLSSQVFVH